jgi:hypothetical protein
MFQNVRMSVKISIEVIQIKKKNYKYQNVKISEKISL